MILLAWFIFILILLFITSFYGFSLIKYVLDNYGIFQ